MLLLAKTVLETLAVLQSEQGREEEVSAVGVVAEKPGWVGVWDGSRVSSSCFSEWLLV